MTVGFRDAHGPEAEAELRMEIDDYQPAYDSIWHRLADLKRQIQRALTRYDSGERGATQGEWLARDLRAVLVDHQQRPHVLSPAEMRAKHLRGRDQVVASVEEGAQG